MTQLPIPLKSIRPFYAPSATNRLRKQPLEKLSSPLLCIISNYINHPLDSRAQNLLKMVEYNAVFLPLYKPNFQNFRVAKKRARVHDWFRTTQTKLATSHELVLTGSVRSKTIWTRTHSLQHHSPATST